MCDALREVIGTYGLAVVCADHPGVMIGARRGSPLIIGIGEGENFLASDANAIVAHTRQASISTITTWRQSRGSGLTCRILGADTAKVQISRLEFEAQDAERGAVPAFHAQGDFRAAARGRKRAARAP